MASPALWAGFVVFVLGMLALDLGVFHRKAHAVTTREALTWTGIWVGLAAVFNGLVWLWFGPERALEFTAGFLVEKALAADNIFVFVMLFSTFAVPAAYQHRVLFWGILGALAMRAAFIAVGAALIAKFHAVLYVFGAILLFTAVKMLLAKDGAVHPENSAFFRLFRRVVPSTSSYHGSKFFVREGGRWLATPLFLVLVLVEVSDLIFAVDSIPAIFAVTRDPFIVFTSNVFAILGLRSMYFLLAGMVGRFHLLKPALAAVLAFVGVKLVLVDVVKIPVAVSLGVIALTIGGAVVFSLLRPKPGKELAA